MTPQEARKAWVQALRSGEYKQGNGYLHYGDTYCCLGVACDLAVKDGVEMDVDADDDEGAVAYDGAAVIPPSKAQSWLGLSDPYGRYMRDDKIHYLTSLNDAGTPFAEIADLIESNPEGLFALTAETYARLARPIDTRGTVQRVRDWFFLRRVLRELNWLRQGVCAPPLKRLPKGDPLDAGRPASTCPVARALAPLGVGHLDLAPVQFVPGRGLTVWDARHRSTEVQVPSIVDEFGSRFDQGDFPHLIEA